MSSVWNQGWWSCWGRVQPPVQSPFSVWLKAQVSTKPDGVQGVCLGSLGRGHTAWLSARGLGRWFIPCEGCYLMGVTWDRVQKCKCRYCLLSQHILGFLLCSLPGHFAAWVTVKVVLVPYTGAQVNPVWCLLPLKVADKPFVPKQDLSLLDEKWNIQEISSTGQQSSVKGKILTLEVCNEMWIIMGEFTNCCQTGAEWC